MMRRLLVSFVLLCALRAQPVEAALAFVNAKSAAPGGVTDASTGTISHTAGNGLVVYARWTDLGDADVSSVTNTASDSWTQCTNSPGIYSNPAFQMACYYTCNTAGNASDDVTVHFDELAFATSVIVLQFSGQATSSCLDASPVVAESFSTTSTSSTFTTSQADTIVFSAVWTSGYASAVAGNIAGAAATIPSGGNIDNLVAEYRILGSVATGQTAEMSWTGNSDWLAFVQAFKQAGAVGGGTCTGGLLLRGVGGC